MVKIFDKRRRLVGSGRELRLRSDFAFVALAILLVGFPVFVRDAYILNIMIIALMFSGLAVSWNFMIGYIGSFSLGHHAFYGLGAYTSALVVMKVGFSPWFALIIAGIVVAFFSFVIGLPCLRLRDAPYIAIATLIFAEIARMVCMNLVELTRGERGLWGIPSFPDINLPWIGIISFGGGARIPFYYLILLILVIMMVTFHFILNSHIGLAFKAIRDSQDASESLGINVTYYKLLAFIISGFFAGVIGGFYAHYILILTPSSVFSVLVMVDILVMTFLGGLGTLIGPVLGAFLVTLGLESLRVLEAYRLISYGILLVVIILFMPAGFGTKLFREKELVE